MEGLIGVASPEKNGLLDKSRALKSTSESIDVNECCLLFDSLTHSGIADIYVFHAYRSPIHCTVMISSETNKITIKKNFNIGSESLGELYYYQNQSSKRWEVYLKNKQNGPMNIIVKPTYGVVLKLLKAELPSEAVKF